MIISLMFLTGVLARLAVSNTLKAMAAVVARMLPQRQVPTVSGDRRTRFSQRRHPHQVMRVEDLEVGREYVSVHVRECDGRMFEYRRTFAGTFSQIAGTFSQKPESSAPPGVHRLSPHYENYTFTVYSNGAFLDKPFYTLWGGDGEINSYGSVACLLGEDDAPDQHQLLVPADRWDDDPHVSVDWTEERPEGETGEKVWMYDSLDHEQRAAIISGLALDARPTKMALAAVYYVTFIRGGELLGIGSCNLQNLGDLTVRRDDEPIDKLWAACT